VAQIADELKDQVTLILDSGPAPGGKPSTVLDTTLSPPILIREGAISRVRIEAAIAIQCILPV
jgi:L-threonylcarbamoyladenylate synthase